MNLELIPSELHYLIDMVVKWGLSDDGYRDEQLFNATEQELKDIIHSLPDNKFEILNNWLVGYANDKTISMTDEYVNYTCYVMAFDMARVLIEKKPPTNK